jgi:hypothetical protein
MVETEGNEHSDEASFWDSKETDDVGRRQEENCGSATTEMGESQSSDGLLV